MKSLQNSSEPQATAEPTVVLLPPVDQVPNFEMTLPDTDSASTKAASGPSGDLPRSTCHRNP